MVGNAQQLQGFFDRPGLVVAAKQDGELAPGNFLGLLEVMDLGGDPFGFVLVVAAGPDAHVLAVAMLAPQLLEVRVRIFRDQGIGAAQDLPAAAVILFELDHLQARIVGGEPVEVFRIGAAPGIDALVVVAHAGQAAARAGEVFQQAVLRAVGILAFVHQQVADALAPGRGQVRIVFQQHQGQPDQIVEIHRVERAQALLVARIQGRSLALAQAARRFLRLLGRQAFVLGARDQAAQGFERILFQSARREILDDAHLVVAVEDREPAPQLRTLVLDLQEPQPQRMEGGNGQALGLVAPDPLGDTLAHFARGLVGEGDRGDVPGIVPAAGDQMRDFFRDHPRLAPAGTGENQ